LVCFATTELESTRQVFYPVDTPVYKNNEIEIDKWIEGSISSFDPSTNTYEISWSDMTAEYIDAGTTGTLVHNVKSYDEYQFRQNEEQEGSLIQERYEVDARIASEVVEEQVYEVGTSVSNQSYDGTWTDGKITRYEKGDYTIKWSNGGTYALSTEDGELDQMVQDAITQNSTPNDEDNGYFPSEMVEPTDSSAMTGESILILLFVLVILVVAGYMRHKKLSTISSTKRSDGVIWRDNGKSGTSLSRQMDDARNLRSTRSIN